MKKVLILEDNKDIRRAISTIVGNCVPNVEILEAANYTEAINIAVLQEIDLFLVDIVLNHDKRGDSSGYEFAKKIRGMEGYVRTPLVYITAQGDLLAKALHSTHCYDFLDKPIDEKKLHAILINTLVKMEGEEKEEEEVEIFYKGVLFPMLASDIVYVEVKRRTLYIHDRYGEDLEFPFLPLKEVLDMIGNGKILQCHRAIAVNKDFVRSIDIVSRIITLKEDLGNVEIGTNYLPLFRKGRTI